ncbi:four helix bundle protein [Spirosoma sp. HMF4905]|uniref:Four helix bundle protein n=1 Tax=Spirosoma arboris TaxID=2682092 RepID=A0A7K1SG53_9BACT|nr:four helix bundle protein [Spirosoma arboris]
MNDELFTNKPTCALKKDNIVLDKSFRFAVRIIRLYQHLKETKKEYILSKQMLRSGTSVGANVREGNNAESKADFIHKLGIAQKETDETIYWLELLKETDYLNQTEFNSIYGDADELLKLIRSIILTAKSNR